MSITTTLKEIKKGSLAPVYCLVGAESFFHDQIIKTIEESLFADPGAKSLNCTRLYGTENTLTDVLSAALGYPMLVQKKLVVVKEFQKLKLSDPDPLLSYLKKPEATTCLVLSCEEAPRNKTFRAIMDASVVVDCKPIPEYQIGDWLLNISRQKELVLEDTAARFLIDHIGTDLLSLNMELDKIKNFVESNVSVSLELVSKITGIDKETSVFNLQTALGRRHLQSSLKTAKRLLESGENINLIIAVLFAFFKKLIMVWQLKQKGSTRQKIAGTLKMRDFQVNQLMDITPNFSLSQLEYIIKVLAETDSDLKSSRSGDYAALQMLCFKICRC